MARKVHCRICLSKGGLKSWAWEIFGITTCLRIVFDVSLKVIHPKYSKHWLSTVAHIIDCVFSKILNHGLNDGLLFSLFKFFGWKSILN